MTETKKHRFVPADGCHLSSDCNNLCHYENEHWLVCLETADSSVHEGEA